MLLLQDERPDGEDFPQRLRHSIWCDPDWHHTLPETGYTCGSGEADGLYIYGTTQLLPFFLSGCLTTSMCPTARGACEYKPGLAFAVESRLLPGGLRLNPSKVTESRSINVHSVHQVKPQLQIFSEEFSKSPISDNTCDVLVAVTADGMCLDLSCPIVLLFTFPQKSNPLCTFVFKSCQ